MYDTTTTATFLITYSPTDQSWAEWIAWQLESAGYSTHIEAWDVRPGMNTTLETDRALSNAQQIIAVLSPASLDDPSFQSVWSAAFTQDPTGQTRRLILVRVHECSPPDLLSPLALIDLANLAQDAARERLLTGIAQGRAKPSSEPGFPGTTSPAPVFPPTWPEQWLVPYQRNPLFTDRKRLLTTLHKQLTRRSQQPAALTQQAISGLGGIGKTQTALEYAYLHQHEYRYVLWANASSSANVLNDYVKFADVLHIPGYDAQDQRTARPAVKAWLGEQRDWLLILDNADDLTILQEYLPTGPHMRGHILLTTRASSVGPQFRAIEVVKMDERDGVELLLKRSGMQTTGRRNRVSKEQRNAAATLVEEMDGLPLAIDQAAGYIDERKCSILDYLQRYQTRRRDVLARGNRNSPYYDETVATTWSLAFARIEQENAAAAELLRFCAFLAPDAIPEELITEGAQYLGDVLGPVAADPLLLDDAIEVLLRYSLVRRNAETKILAIHRLVQVVVRYEMEEEEQRMWAERVTRACYIFLAYKEYEDFNQFEHSRLYIYYACLDVIDRYEIDPIIAARLLHTIGYSLQEYARYEEALRILQKALSITEKTLGAEHQDTGVTLHEIGLLYHRQGKYPEAEQSLKRALNIFEKVLQNQPPYYRLYYTAAVLNSLGATNYKQRKYQEAIELYERTLDVYREIAGSLEYPPAAITLQNIALAYQDKEMYEESEKLFKQALNILEKGQHMGTEITDIAAVQGNLAYLYHKKGKRQEAEKLYQQALLLREKVLGLKHPDTIDTAKSYAEFLQEIGREEEAEKLNARINAT